MRLNAITLICILLLIGAAGKSAQIGSHTWSPDAMEGPTPVSALIHAATMMEKYVFMREVGSGSFGVVWKAYNAQTGETVAIKQLFKLTKSWEVEVEALNNLKNHPNIVTLKETLIQHNHTATPAFFMVFEYMTCNLFELMDIRSKINLPFTEAEIKHMCFQVFAGLAYMHHNVGYFHRDLKPENLLVSSKLGRLVVKIGDLGMARKTNSPLPLEHQVTTPWYRAPEVFLRSSSYNSAVDMWAMGAIMAELFTNQPLFNGDTNLDIMDKHCSVLGTPTKETWFEGLDLARNVCYKFPKDVGGVRPFCELLPNASLDAANLIASLLSWDPNERPTAMEVLQHPFFHAYHPVPPTTVPTVFTKAMKRELMKYNKTSSHEIYIGSVKLLIPINC